MGPDLKTSAMRSPRLFCIAAALLATAATGAGAETTTTYPHVAWKSANAAIDHAVLMMTMGDHNQSAHIFSWAVADQDQAPSLVLQHAQVLYLAGRYDDAMDALVAVLEKVPGQVEHLLFYVAAATRRGGDEFETAREVAQQHYITSFSSPCTGAIHGLFLEGKDVPQSCGDNPKRGGFIALYYRALYTDASHYEGTGEFLREALDHPYARDRPNDFRIRAARAHAIERGAWRVEDCPCDDDATWVDKYGEHCAAHAGFDCLRYHLSFVHEYSMDDQDAMLDKCPRSCNLCAVDCRKTSGEL